jgi:hypothetical protein
MPALAAVTLSRVNSTIEGIRPGKDLNPIPVICAATC